MTSSNAETQSLSRSQTQSDYLILDAHTLKDLEIFESATGAESLFEFCDFTRTEGGAKELRKRMELPWSNVDRIHATQESISFILEQRQAFIKLPSYITRSVEQYQREVLMLVTQDNWLEFSIGAFSIWANDRHYHAVLRGVQFACGLIRASRRFVGQAELNSPEGELVSILAEMRELLNRPRLQQVPEEEIGGRRPWRVLRLDQTFRMHEKESIFRLLQLIYEVDALVSMATATRKHGFILPRVEEGLPSVQAEGLVHPFVANAVANPVVLDQQRRLLFLTGPNMAGKTTYLRAFAIALYLGHMGMGVPARDFRFAPAQRLFSSITLSDDLRAGISYFRAEALRVKAIAQAIAENYRVVAILDEPFKGTNVKDALDASLAIMERFATRKGCLFMFSSHLIELKEQINIEDQINCCHFEAEEDDGRLRFDYTLRPGVSTQRLGLRVLQEEGVFELLDRTMGSGSIDSETFSKET